MRPDDATDRPFPRADAAAGGGAAREGRTTSGPRDSFSDLGQTVAELLGADGGGLEGQSFVDLLGIEGSS